MTRWLACTITLVALAIAAPARAAIPVYGYMVVHTYPHDTGASTVTSTGSRCTRWLTARISCG